MNSPPITAFFAVLLSLVFTNTAIYAANLPSTPSGTPEIVSDVRVECNSNEILVSISTNSGRFTGMVYPRGLSKNSTCMGEWVEQDAPVKYALPLRSCNTMSTELEDEAVEYYNTIVVQPHLKLVTNQGRGFHVRCKYNTRNNNISMDNDDPRADPLSTDVHQALAPMPGCTMKIFSGDPSQKEVAESVKIGDPLTLVISIDKQETYGLRITDCLVRDGLGWGEQKLIDDDGCPVDKEIMGMFEYTEDKIKASVHFQAHKFPYTASVYYQCNVKLCLKADHSCAALMAPKCGSNRLRRQAENEGTPATIEVYSGLYVNEANELGKAGPEEDSVFSQKTPEDSICISQKSFAIGICIAGLILMLCVIAAILCLLASRRRKKTTSQTGSSIYSGPYTNTAYSHSS